MSDKTHSFFGIFSYEFSETESCDFATYFIGISLEKDIILPNGKKLSAGYECGEGYLDHHGGEFQFVEDWRCASCKSTEFNNSEPCCKGGSGHIEPNVSYEIPISDLYKFRWENS